MEYTCCNFNFKSITRNNHVGSLGLHFLSNCCLCFHANGNLGGDFPLDQPPLPRSSRPSEEKGGPLDNPQSGGNTTTDSKSNPIPAKDGDERNSGQDGAVVPNFIKRTRSSSLKLQVLFNCFFCKFLLIPATLFIVSCKFKFLKVCEAKFSFEF